MKRITRGRRLGIAMGASVAVALSTCGAALADGPTETTTTVNGITLTGVSGGTEAQKLAWIAAHPLPNVSSTLATSLATGAALAAGSATVSALESKAVRNNVGNAYLEVDGTVTLTYSDATNYSDSFTDTNSDAEWLGTSPSVNCTWIDPTEEWTVNSPSVSASYPAGVSISNSSQVATLDPGHYANMWQAPLSKQQAVKFSSDFYVDNPHYITGATFLLGGQGYALSGVGG